jgi:hypothetical protein
LVILLVWFFGRRVRTGAESDDRESAKLSDSVSKKKPQLSGTLKLKTRSSLRSNARDIVIGAFAALVILIVVILLPTILRPQSNPADGGNGGSVGNTSKTVHPGGSWGTTNGWGTNNGWWPF